MKDLHGLSLRKLLEMDTRHAKSLSGGITVEQAVRSVLGEDRVTTDESVFEQGGAPYLLGRPWVPGYEGIFSSMDSPSSGSIGVAVPLHSTKPEDVAVAVHEATHAFLHLNGIPDGPLHRESEINRLTELWLKAHYEGSDLQRAVATLGQVERLYGDSYRKRGVEIPPEVERAFEKVVEESPLHRPSRVAGSGSTPGGCLPGQTQAQTDCIPEQKALGRVRAKYRRNT